MTNQSELVETVLSILGIVDRKSGNRPEQIATLEQELTAYITANYTPNSEVAERERVARIDELERLKSLHSRTYKQTVTDNMGNVYVEDSHGYISSYETQERIAELTKAKDQPDER